MARKLGTPFDKKVGGRIRDLRDARGWSQEGLAARLPGAPTISGSQLAKKERGEEQITIDLVRRVALALNAPLGRLMEGDADMEDYGLAGQISDLDARDREAVEYLVGALAQKSAPFKAPLEPIRAAAKKGRK